jgi:hypothetical protein
MRRYGESKTTRIMKATVPHVTSGLGLRKFLTDGFLLGWVYQRISSGLWHIYLYRTKASFYGEELLAPRPTPKLKDHPSPAVHGCLFNIFAATLHFGGCSSIRNLRTGLVVVTGTHLSWPFTLYTRSNVHMVSTRLWKTSLRIRGFTTWWWGYYCIQLN